MTPLPLAANAPPSGSALSDLGLATLVVAVIVMMALPLPAWSLDMLVAVNIALAVLLLLVALFIPTPLAFSTFPAVLLVTTLFRISLNVATTRQILLHAHAGDIIAAFGRLVVGGSLVVGLVVFLIITVVQFIVVAKGAERVAEVSARFTLDAMPGKQMSIDADLRAGMLSQAEALQRRRELVQESQFYGAMDGAMKFVKGDAIAGIVIVLVNLLGGIAIGTLSMGLGFGAAVQKFSVLSIGDGLVTQIPALFVSIAAGIAITRTAPDGSANLGQQIGRQLGGQPRALLMSAGVMVLFAGVPGFPTFTFLGLAALLGVLGVTLTRTPRAQGQQRAEQEVPSAAREGDKNPVLLQAVRGAKVGFVFQDPMTSLNPVFTVGSQIMEPLIKHMGLTKAQASDRAAELLALVGIPDAKKRLKSYPHQFSGGMRQRVMIAIALACDPDVLIADEPTTALDVTIQAQIIELIKDLRQKLGMAIVWITHDLGVIAGIADRVMVMYGGQVVEQAPVRELFANPQHPYTRALLKTVPSLTGERADRLQVIEGQPPILSAAPVACPFRGRCAHAFDRCEAENPQRRAVDGKPLGAGHDVACHWTAGAA